MSEEFTITDKDSFSKKKKRLSSDELQKAGLDYLYQSRQSDEEIRLSQKLESSEAKEKMWVDLVGKQYAQQLNLSLLTLGNQEAARKAFAWAKKPEKKGLRIVGPSRAGKTRTASAAIKAFVQMGKSVCRLDGQEFAFFATSAARNTEEGSKWINQVCSHDLVFIDDFAKDFRETTARVAQIIIEKMFRNEKIMLLTTQFSREMIEDSLLLGKDERGRPLRRSENQHLVDSLNGRLIDYFETVQFT